MIIGALIGTFVWLTIVSIVMERRRDDFKRTRKTPVKDKVREYLREDV